MRHSSIRDNIIKILSVAGECYGYRIWRIYTKAFSKANIRTIYYHLNFGVKEGVFQKEVIKQEDGNYSWGKGVERVYYKLSRETGKLFDEDVFRVLKEIEEKK